MNDVKQAERGDRVTIRTVAEDAGVSVAAVSKVLRNAYGVSDALRQKVMQSIERLEYRPSIAARGMRGQTYTVGILLVEISNPFLPGIIEGVNAKLAPSRYKAMIGVGGAQIILETSLIDSMIDHKMDGLILVAPRLPGEVISEFARRVPIVTIGYHYPEAPLFDTVNADDQRGAALAVEALAERGYRDIAMLTLAVSEGHTVSVVYQREIGYRETMTRLGLGDHMRIFKIPGHGTEAEQHIREKAIFDILTREDRPRAIFSWSDLDAVRILAAAYKLGIRVPEDLAIVGFDNSPLSGYPMFDLASIDQSGYKLGRMAARALLGRIGGRAEASHEKLETHLVVRGSLG